MKPSLSVTNKFTHSFTHKQTNKQTNTLVNSVLSDYIAHSGYNIVDITVKHRRSKRSVNKSTAVTCLLFVALMLLAGHLQLLHHHHHRCHRRPNLEVRSKATRLPQDQPSPAPACLGLTSLHDYQPVNNADFSIFL